MMTLIETKIRYFHFNSNHPFSIKSFKNMYSLDTTNSKLPLNLFFQDKEHEFLRNDLTLSEERKRTTDLSTFKKEIEN